VSEFITVDKIRKIKKYSDNKKNANYKITKDKVNSKICFWDWIGCSADYAVQAPSLNK
jgi:hypothetical protein